MYVMDYINCFFSTIVKLRHPRPHFPKSIHNSVPLTFSEPFTFQKHTDTCNKSPLIQNHQRSQHHEHLQHNRPFHNHSHVLDLMRCQSHPHFPNTFCHFQKHSGIQKPLTFPKSSLLQPLLERIKKQHEHFFILFCLSVPMGSQLPILNPT